MTASPGSKAYGRLGIMLGQEDPAEQRRKNRQRRDDEHDICHRGQTDRNREQHAACTDTRHINRTIAPGGQNSAERGSALQYQQSQQKPPTCDEQPPEGHRQGVRVDQPDKQRIRHDEEHADQRKQQSLGGGIHACAMPGFERDVKRWRAPDFASGV